MQGILQDSVITENNVLYCFCVQFSLFFFFLVFLSSDRHDLIKKLHGLKESNSELAGLLLEQVLRITSGYGKHFIRLY